MGALARGVLYLCAFLLGVIATLGPLYWASATFRGIWLPIVFSAFVFLMLGTHPRSRQPGARWWGTIALAGGVTGLWLRSTENLSNPFLAQNLGTVLIAIGIAALLATLRAAARGRSSERPGGLALVGLILCGWLLAYLSGGKGEPGWMERLLMDWFRLESPVAHAWTVGIRKSLHFLFYGVVALLALGIIRRPSGPGSTLFPLGIAAGYAAFDELRQVTSAGRTGSAWDFLLDMAGAIVFLIAAGRRR